MFRPTLKKDLVDVFGFAQVRITGLDDESEVLYFNPIEIVSTPVVGSGKTHFRVYGELGIYQDEANGKFSLYYLNKEKYSSALVGRKFVFWRQETDTEENGNLRL